jgi:hypothetical protein
MIQRGILVAVKRARRSVLYRLTGNILAAVLVAAFMNLVLDLGAAREELL